MRLKRFLLCKILKIYFNHSVNLLQAFMKDLLPVKFFGRCILVGFTQGDNDRD